MKEKINIMNVVSFYIITVVVFASAIGFIPASLTVSDVSYDETVDNKEFTSNDFDVEQIENSNDIYVVNNSGEDIWGSYYRNNSMLYTSEDLVTCEDIGKVWESGEKRKCNIDDSITSFELDHFAEDDFTITVEDPVKSNLENIFKVYYIFMLFGSVIALKYTKPKKSVSIKNIVSYSIILISLVLFLITFSNKLFESITIVYIILMISYFIMFIGLIKSNISDKKE